MQGCEKCERHRKIVGPGAQIAAHKGSSLQLLAQNVSAYTNHFLLCNISGCASRASVASHGRDTDPRLCSTRTVGGATRHEPGSSRKRITGPPYCIPPCLDVRRHIPGTSQVFFNLGSLESTLTRCTTEVSRKMLMKCSRLLDMATIDQDVESNGIALIF